MKSWKRLFRDIVRDRAIRWVGVVALAMGLLIGPLMAQGAAAEISGCRDDPIVHLSDGTIVKVHTTVADAASDVHNVTYTLYAPAGTSVTNVVYTGGQLAGKETIQVFSNNLPATYDTDTVVSTGTAGVSVTAWTEVPSVGTASVTGQSGQDLAVHIGG